jgi:DNA-directed RNA polymerase specialized sigma24 family protein
MAGMLRSVCTTARKRKLQEAEAEELASAVKIKLFEDDCAVIRNFRGESKLSTYLHVLIDRATLDICTKRRSSYGVCREPKPRPRRWSAAQSSSA